MELVTKEDMVASADLSG